MSWKWLGVVLLLAVSVRGFGAVGQKSVEILGAPFDMPAICESVFPARDFSIVDFGARPDGSVCTEAIANAMAACAAAGGGRVVVPKGTWLTGAVHFRSGCELHFEDGAILEFTDNPDDYPEVETTWEGVECLAHSPLVFGYKVTDVAITGKGLIRPRMKLWRDWFERPPEHMKLTEMLYHWCSTNAPLASRRVLAVEGANVRPHLIQFNQAKNVRLEGFTIRESPFWTIHLYRSENCIVRGLDMSARGHNNDGIDIDMTRNVIVEDCTLAQGDDGICLKAGRNQDAWRINRPTENVVVRRCRVKCATTLLGIGSELSGGIRNIWVTDCDVDAAGILFRVKTNRRRGGFVRDVWMDNCRVSEVARILLVEMDVLYQWANFPDYEIRRTPIENLSLSDVTCERADIAFHVVGDPLLKPRNINLKNVSIGSVTEDYVRLSDCDEVTTDNVRLAKFDSSLRYPFCGKMPVDRRLSEMSVAHRKAIEFLSRPNLGTMGDGRYELGDGAVAEIAQVMLRPCSEATYETDYDHDTLIFLFCGEDGAFTTKATSIEHVWVGRYARQLTAYVNQYVFIPAGVRYADRLIYGNPQPTRRCVVKIPYPKPRHNP